MDREGGLTLRAAIAPVFLPVLVYEIGNGAVLPVIALTALDLGASVGTAGFVLTVLGIGQLLGDLPSSYLVSRFGDRRAMLVAALISAAGQGVCAVTGSLPLLLVVLLVIGACNSTFYLARHAYVSDAVPPTSRARALSTLAGSHRIGLFVGPFVGALAISAWGVRAPFLVAVASAAVVVVLLLTVPAPSAGEGHRASGGAAMTSLAMARRCRSLYATLGLAVLAVGAVRAARQTVLPLWATHIGLDATATSVVFGVANALDMALFYPSGLVMDRRGRRAVAIPSMLLLGVGLTLITVTDGVTGFAAAACLVSVGNGIGSGIMMTLGADSAPADNRVAFLSVWRGLGDAGNALGPIVVSTLAATTTLVCGVLTAGVLGVVAAAGLLRWAPRYSAHWRRAGQRADVMQPVPAVGRTSP